MCFTLSLFSPSRWISKINDSRTPLCQRSAKLSPGKRPSHCKCRIKNEKEGSATSGDFRLIQADLSRRHMDRSSAVYFVRCLSERKQIWLTEHFVQIVKHSNCACPPPKNWKSRSQMVKYKEQTSEWRLHTFVKKKDGEGRENLKDEHSTVQLAIAVVPALLGCVAVVKGGYWCEVCQRTPMGIWNASVSLADPVVQGLRW
ncbi:hypothetical protein CEXT_704821 [Caerostris extrusa]|uniref:Uncharacterized protein n=1 Tax=Caerostris extrusa TaxID=172846 RepID=A0AAV4VX30_CAEEX|nr:hypothetical protein CEXT_704821 [Caerostris extrusa]